MRREKAEIHGYPHPIAPALSLGFRYIMIGEGEFRSLVCGASAKPVVIRGALTGGIYVV